MANFISYNCEVYEKTVDFDCCEKALQIREQVFNEVAYVCLNALQNFEDGVVTNQNLIDAWDQKDVDARIIIH